MSKPLRICIVSQEYPPETGGGGIGTQAYLKAQGLSARGHHVEVVSASWDNPRTEYDGKALIHRLRPEHFGVDAMETFTEWMTYSLSVAKKLQELQAEENFDIIQFPEYVGEGFFHQTNNFRYRKARYSVQLHGPLGMFAEHMSWPQKHTATYKVGCFMEKSVIHHSDGILASSHNTAKFCSSYYDYPLDQINVIHSGINIDKFSPLPREEDDSFPKILFVGNLAGAKGFNLLVETISRMSKRYPKIKLRTIGKGGDESVPWAKKYAAEFGAEKNIEFLRYVHHSDLPKHFAWSDMFAGPSIYEPGPGNVYLEAMACARPVIACNTAGAPEVVLNERTGLLISSQDTVELERAIIRLAEDAALRDRLGTGGRKWVSDNFSIEKYIDKVEQFYQRLMQQPQRGKEG